MEMRAAQRLEEARRREPFTMSQMVTEVARLIPGVAAVQTRYRVTAYPDERTIRFYVNAGLVDRPAQRRGNAGLFSYRSLLQILAIKKLQSEYLPLRKIREVTQRLDEAGLEHLILGGGTAGSLLALPDVCFSRPAVESARFDTVEPEEFALQSAPMKKVPSARERRHRLESLRSAADLQQDVMWLRLPVAEGVELHISSDSPAGRSRQDRERLAAQVRVCVAKHLEKILQKEGRRNG